MAIDGSALFPTADRNGRTLVQSFGLPIDGSAMIVGADRNGNTVLAPVGIPINNSPMVGVADRNSEGLGVTFGTARSVYHSIVLNVPSTNGQADTVCDNWSCGSLSDAFGRADGNPRSLPDYLWYSNTGPPSNASAQILNFELAGLWASVPAGGSAFWWGDPIFLPYVMKATIDVRNIVLGGGGTWGIADWRLGTSTLPGPIARIGELRVYKLADPDLKAYVQIVARRGIYTGTSGVVIFPNLASVFGNELVVTVSETQTKVQFLGLTQTI